MKNSQPHLNFVNPITSITLITLITLLLASCGLLDDKANSPKKKVVYSYTCIDSTVGESATSKKLRGAGAWIRDAAVGADEVTDAIQSEHGREFHEEVLKSGEFKLLDDAAIQSALQATLDSLLSARGPEGSKIDYHIYALADTVLNAFTFGGRIYVTKAMYQKCGGPGALLTAIVGHEVGHNETGHIRKAIQEMKLAEKVFGSDNSSTAIAIKRLLTGAFNQRHELEADYYGIGLAHSLDLDLCPAVQFWKDLSSKENGYSGLEDFFRTHPYSALRSSCLQSHIAENYGSACTAQ